MSLLPHERILVGLAPERLSALSLGGLVRPRLLDRHAVSLSGQDAGEWDAGIQALEALLAEPAWRGREIAVVLSGHYVRHAVFPAGRGLAADERQALAATVFRDTFGELARDWELRVGAADDAAQTLACGVPRALLVALRGVCGGRGQLHAVRPVLMPVFNRVRAAVGSSAGCLALVEPGRLTLAFVENGAWKHVDSRAGDGNALPQLLLEEGELNQRQPGGILWLCDLTGAARAPADTFWSMKRVAPPHLPGFDALSSLAIWGLAQ